MKVNGLNILCIVFGSPVYAYSVVYGVIQENVPDSLEGIQSFSPMNNVITS